MTLGEMVAEGRDVSGLWAGYRGGSWWWCKDCFAVCQAAEIRVTRDGAELCLECPHCEAPGESLYWWHGWPALVLDRWRAWPRSGDVYPLPQDWHGDAAAPEEPGTRH